MQVKEMRASVRAGSSRPEDHVFFIYDRTALKSEWDDPETAILFFLPNAVPIKDQCSLCGQLVGMVSFFEGLLVVPPRIFKLKNGKFAIKCVDNFVMALGGKLSDADNLLSKLLSDLYSVFQFFHKSFDSVLQEDKPIDEVKRRMIEIWHCYVPFVRHYRQDTLAFLDTVQYLDFGKYGLFTYLKAMQILEACQRRTQALCGCIISKEKVVASQVQPDILRFLAFLRPSQDHLPISHLNIDGDLPQGVRIYPVYVRRKVYEEIFETSNRTPYSLMKNKRNRRNSSENDMEARSLERRSDRVDEFLSNISKSMSLGRSLVGRSPDDKTLAMSTTFGFNEDKDSGVLSRDLNISESSSISDQTELRSRKSTNSSANIDFSTYSNLESDSLDWHSEKARSNSFDGSEIDAILEKKFGGNLEDLKESVRKFNLCYKENDDGTDNRQSRPSQTWSSQAEWTSNDDVTPVGDDTTINAFKRTCEYIEKCSEKTKNYQADDVKVDLNSQKMDCIFSKKVDNASDSIIHEDTTIRTDQNGTPTELGTLSVDDTEVNENESNRLTDVNTGLNSRDKDKMSDDSSRFLVLADFEHQDRDTSENFVNEQNDLDGDIKKVLSKSSDCKSNDIDSDSASLASTDNSNLQSSCSGIVNESSLSRNLSSDIASSFEDNNRPKPVLHHIDTKINELACKEYDRIKPTGNTVYSSQTREQRKNSAFADAVVQKLKSEKLRENEIHLSGDDGYSSMDKDLDRQRNEATEKEVSQSRDESNSGWTKETLLEDKDDLMTLHLYVQSNSNTVLIVFLEPQSDYDQKMLRSIYEIVVAQLGDLELGVQHLLENTEANKYSDEFVYLTYNSEQKTQAGNCMFISQRDYIFGNAMATLHAQFSNSKTMAEATFRDYKTAVYGKRTNHQETYYQPRGNYKPIQGAPTPYDGSCVLDRRLNSKLRKDNVGIIL
ncbi:uncharacterized protein LOC135683623 [Rhopilema esculentum]|uniref:uncharacterized protein LOC135683623 n=1 Tax=Rhopilema esculentum TaxID=499914 RepID=UPI0031D55B67|eukprot:gene15769-7067_t